MRDRHHRDCFRAGGSSARRCENRLAAASMRSPRAERFNTPAACRRLRQVLVRTRATLRRPRRGGHRGATVCAAHNARPACRARAARRPRRAAGKAGRLAVAPARASIASRGTPPGRSKAGAPRQATIVDSTPTGVAPPSTMRSMRPRKSARTCAAVVGETWPERFADGATTGLPKAARIFCATSWFGTRTAMVSRPAVASSATGQPGAFGQNQRQRPRPKRFGKPRRIGIKARQRPRRRKIDHMGDERIERRPALGLVEARDGLAVGGVGAEAVNRLGRKGDEPAGRKAAHRIPDRGGIGPRHACHQPGCHCGSSVPK